jgi:hypothetical protein
MLSLVQQLSTLRPNSTFLTLKGYRNAYQEVADYNLIFHASYANSLRRSIDILKQFKPTDTFETQARQELLNSYQSSFDDLSKASIDEQLDVRYAYFKDEHGKIIKGVKFHSASNSLHLYGIVAYKKVIIEGIYPKTKKHKLTLVKDKLRKMCPLNKWRQFKILRDQVEAISVQSLTILPPLLEEGFPAPPIVKHQA